MHDARLNRAETARDHWWLDRRGWWLAAIGLVLVASGVAHAVVWGVLGGPWEGPITWRKPILFGISGGVTAVSLGWAWSKLPVRRGDIWLAAATAWALAIEVALIDLQRWRGVASHFNRQTQLDSRLYDLMGSLILFVTLVIADLTIRFFRQRAAVAADMLLAVRAGLVFLTASCLLGIWASVHGDVRAAAGLPPETFGAAGVMKFPHGIAMHAVQLLPLLVWLATRAGLPEPRRWWLVASATAGTAVVAAYALAQTLAGRSRFDLSPATAAILVIGVALTALPVIPVLVSLAPSRRAGPTGARRAVDRGRA